MSDNAQVLNTGLGMPLVWLFDNNNNPIKFTDKTFDLEKEVNLSEFLIDFKYVYDEENDDECTIKFQFQSVDQANAAYLEEDTIIYIKWGYVLPGGNFTKSPLRMISIRNIDVDQQPDKILIEWKCTDLVSYLRNTKSNLVSDHDFFEDWLREVIDGRFIATITTAEKLTIISNTKKEIIIVDKFKRSLLQDKVNETTTIIGRTIERTVIPGQSEALQKEKELRAKGKSVYGGIQEELNKAIDGPYHLDGRDDNLDIKKRNWNQKPFASYTFSGNTGELLSFKSKTNLKAKKLDTTENTTVNPITKKIISKEDRYKLSDGTIITDAEMAEIVRLARKTWDHNINFPLNQIEFNAINIRREQWVDVPDNTYPVVKDNTRVKQQFLKKYRRFQVPIKTILNMPGFHKQYNEAVLRNYILKKMEKNFTAKAKIIGDPTLISSKIYKFNNIIQKDSGDWYAQKVEHTIDSSSGYMCLIHLIRKPKVVAIIKLKKERKVINSQDKIKEITETETETETQYAEGEEPWIQDFIRERDSLKTDSNRFNNQMQRVFDNLKTTERNSLIKGAASSPVNLSGDQIKQILLRAKDEG